MKIDPATGELISQAAHFLGMTKKDFVAEEAKAYPEQRREEVRRGIIESMKVLDGSLTSSVSTLTGLSPERIEALRWVLAEQMWIVTPVGSVSTFRIENQSLSGAVVTLRAPP